MAFVAETVVGATAGAVPPAQGYFKRMREICDRYGVLLILDEVMCGMGRTGTLHACEQEGIAPDLMTIAKGLGGGYAADRRGAAGRARSTTPSPRASGFFQHGHTYMGHPLACAAGLAVQEVIRRDNLLANVRGHGRAVCSAGWASASAIIPCRRHPRPRPVPGDRAGRGPRRPRRRSIRR